MEPIEHTLDEVLVEVLETYAFMFAEPLNPASAAFGESSYLEAKIAFGGPLAGNLRLVAPYSFCRHLSANILGMEPDGLSAEHAGDALRELLNVVCGEFLEAANGSEAVSNLSVPCLSIMTAAQARDLANSSHASVMLVEDSPVMIQLNTAQA
jgi:hypothetical protein